MKLLELGRVYKIEDAHNFVGYGVYMGHQKGFECCICGKGCNCKTFNILHSDDIQEGLRLKDNGDYETFGYGNEHMPKLTKTEYYE